MRSVIRILNPRNIKPPENHRLIVEIYGENVLRDGIVRRSVRQFNDGRTNVHNKTRSGRPSVVNDDLVQKMNEKIHGNRWFTIRMSSNEFSHISKNVLHRLN